MFKKPVWDDLSFVTWCIILQEVAIRRWVHCSHKGMDMVSNNTPGRLWRLNDAQLVLRGPKCAKKISPTHYTTTTSSLNQDGSMLSCSFCQILTLPSECRSRNRDSSDQATFSRSSMVQFWWACANCSLRFLFLADRSSTQCDFCCCSPSASGFDVLCIQRWHSAYLGCKV